MFAMKPRTSNGELEVVKEGRGFKMLLPAEGGGRHVIEMTPDEAEQLRAALEAVQQR